MFWGHEHDCYPEPFVNNNTHIFQCGSSVATSLSKGESMVKHMFKMQVYNDKFAVEPVPFKTVRPMIFQDYKYVEFCKDVFFANHELTDAQL